MNTRRVVQGYGKRLDVNLSSGDIVARDIDPEFAKAYVGGVGFSAKILYDEVGPAIDPLGPDNVVIIANGVLTGTNTLCASRTEITTKSPLTGHLGTGNTGGTWGAALKRAGFDLIVICGRASRPVYIWVDDDKVELKDAGHLWGKNTDATTVALESELGGSSPSEVKVLTIGPAGENLVRFACPMNDYYHCAARNGAGAVMGSKHLKAVAVRGTGVVKAARPDEFQAATRAARERARQYHSHSGYTCWGTDRPSRKGPARVGYQPGRNYQDAVLRDWEERFDYLTGVASPCHACPDPCFKLAEVKEGKYAGVKATRATHVGVIAAWGAKCAIDNMPAIWKCKQLSNQLGLDYDSAAGVVAFAMELYQRGLLTKADADGLELTWGNEDAVVELLQKIANRDGLGNTLAEGSQRAARAIAPEAARYVMAVKGLEMMQGVDPRSGVIGAKAWVFGDLTNPRGGDNIKGTHFHIDRYLPTWWVDKFDMFDDVKKRAYGIDVAPEKFGSVWEGKPTLVKWFEDMYSVANTLGVCFFAVGFAAILGPTHFSKLFSAYIGRETSPEEVATFGEKLFTIMKAYICREGLSRKDDAWADRFYDEPLPNGPRQGSKVSREDLDRVLDEYYELRGWDKKTSLPTEQKLVALGLTEIANDLRAHGKLPAS